MATINCTHCGLSGDQQPFRTFATDLGQRIFESICTTCWGEWLKYQQALINHHGLNLRDPKAKEFLVTQMEQFLFTTETQL